MTVIEIPACFIAFATRSSVHKFGSVLAKLSISKKTERNMIFKHCGKTRSDALFYKYLPMAWTITNISSTPIPKMRKGMAGWRSAKNRPTWKQNPKLAPNENSTTIIPVKAKSTYN